MVRVPLAEQFVAAGKKCPALRMGRSGPPGQHMPLARYEGIELRAIYQPYEPL